MVRLNHLLFALPAASAWPMVMEMVAKSNLAERQESPLPVNPLVGRPNTATPPAGFNEREQFVDTRPGSGHEYQRPGPGDLRGQCPGLNAAANHGFLPRNGLTNIQQTIDGLVAAYHMAASQALILSIFSIAISGDVITQTWSIGSGFDAGLPLLANPLGLTGTHNTYEGDASVVSGDAYMHNGRVGEFEMARWEDLWSIGEDGYGFDNLAQHNVHVIDKSIAENPYYFAAPLSGNIVTPGAHNFMVVFMSNHSEAEPGGYLTRSHLKDFFGVKGDAPGEFSFDIPSQKIPDQWYKMPFANSYTIQQTAADALLNGVVYPGITRLGGNTGTVNSFAGIDSSDLSGGLFNAQALTDPNKLLCFAIQFTQAANADQADVLGFLTSQLGGTLATLGCPALGHTKFNMKALDKFPGWSYRPTGV